MARSCHSSLQNKMAHPCVLVLYCSLNSVVCSIVMLPVIGLYFGYQVWSHKFMGITVLLTQTMCNTVGTVYET